MKNKNGFTLIEMLTVIVVLGLLMSIAAVAVTSYIEESKLNSYVSIAKEYIGIASTELAKQEKLIARDSNTVYYIHINNLKTEKENTRSPFGEWVDAYVIVTIDPDTGRFTYYWSSIDSAGYSISEEKDNDLNKSSIEVNTRTSISTSNTIGGRDNIVIYDKDGNKITNVPPSLEIEDEQKDCFEYVIDEKKGVEITGYDKSCGTDLHIPTKIDGIDVYKISDNAFKNKGITNVTIYKGLEEIGYGAFQENKIDTVKLSITVKKVSDYAFYNSKIKNLIMSEGIEEIGTYSFANNNICDVLLPGSLKKIGSFAFANNCLTKVNIPAGVSVSGGTFNGNDIDDNYAFIYYKNADGTADYSYLVGYAGNNVDNIVIPAEKNGVALEKIGSYAFKSIGLNGHIEIPDTVTSIGSDAFAFNNLSSVHMPSSLKTIGSGAFRNNYLESFDIPSGVTSIGVYAFNANKVTGQEGIVYARSTSGIVYDTIVSYGGGRATDKTITIPAVAPDGTKLRLIKSSAFQACGLVEINLPDLSQVHDKFTIQSGAFKNNNVPGPAGFIYDVTNGVADYSKISNYAGPSNGVGGVITIPATAPDGTPLTNINTSFSWLSFKKIIIPSTVTVIKTSAFQKAATNNNKLVTIVNKTGREFNWAALTDSTYTNNNTFVTGTIKHHAGNIEVVATE